MRSCLLVAAVTILFMTTTSLAAPVSLRFSCSPDSDKRAISKLTRELVALSATAAGIALEFKDYPWPRVVTLLKSGEIEGSHCLTYTESRESWLRFLDVPFHESGSYFYKLSSNTLEYESLQQLLALRIAAYSGSVAAEVLTQLQVKRVEYVHNIYTSCRMLSAGRIDLLIGAGLTEGIFCSTGKVDTSPERVAVEKIGPPIYLNSIQLGISKTYPHHEEVLAALRRGLMISIDNGDVERIYKNHELILPDKLKLLIDQRRNR